MELNEVIAKLPRHLMNYVIEQPYNEYTAQDHAVWRYVMRQNVRHLSRVAHSSYVEGLKATGISIESIPHMYGMNRILKEIGWAAVAVDGFIPPAAFMEFQAYNVLVIAADIRPIDQIEYTPAPDIIHEAAGHAPIIADREYAEYLRLFGKYGSKAFSSKRDYEVYEAIRHLSILKADPYTPEPDIENAEKYLENLENTRSEVSEMSMIRNLHWWTVEYGLIGDLDNPRIYGAGLLSSIGESISCLEDDVVKLPYSIEAARHCFDITNTQPLLFVTPSFNHLTEVLEKFADTMAFRRGGVYGLSQAVKSESTATVVYSSGLQVTGIIESFIGKNGNPVYIKTSGPSALCYNDRQLDGHGRTYHTHGFGSPAGRLNSIDTPLEFLTETEQYELGITHGSFVNLEFESGFTVKGKVINILRRENKTILITFSECTATFENETFFKPEWGLYDMAVGESITSVFNGSADPDSFELTVKVPDEKTHKIKHSAEKSGLFSLYSQVRNIRENGSDFEMLPQIWETIKKDYTNDWLLPLEILEIANNSKDLAGLRLEILEYLAFYRDSRKGFGQLINNGLEILGLKQELEPV